MFIVFTIMSVGLVMVLNYFLHLFTRLNLIERGSICLFFYVILFMLGIYYSAQIDELFINTIDRVLVLSITFLVLSPVLYLLHWWSDYRKDKYLDFLDTIEDNALTLYLACFVLGIYLLLFGEWSI